MYSKKPNYILGFHGCDQSICFDLLNGRRQMKPSNNAYDWLGPGMYFWEGNLDRARNWAQEQVQRGKIDKAAVIGCVIDLGYCLDFLDSKYLMILKPTYERLKGSFEISGNPLPENQTPVDSNDFLIRELDCAVIQMIHQDKRDQSETPFDTVRGVFWEGTAPYPNAGFKERNHIQVCVRNSNCLKGFFLPRSISKGGITT